MKDGLRHGSMLHCGLSCTIFLHPQQHSLISRSVKLQIICFRGSLNVPGGSCRKVQPEAVRAEMVPTLLNGITSHHAGCLPGWKGLIERLFQRGEYLPHVGRPNGPSASIRRVIFAKRSQPVGHPLLISMLGELHSSTSCKLC